eukprot:Rhum_TRINITY_DN14946_c11_g10::Rhum_TRINITY_DN14946_c11_g10_i1::g.132439::m.132439
MGIKKKALKGVVIVNKDDTLTAEAALDTLCQADDAENDGFEVIDWTTEAQQGLVTSTAQTEYTALSSDVQSFLDAHVDDFVCPDDLDHFETDSFQDVCDVFPASRSKRLSAGSGHSLASLQHPAAKVA